MRIEAPSMGTFYGRYNGVPYQSGMTEVSPGQMPQRFPLTDANRQAQEVLDQWQHTTIGGSATSIGQTIHQLNMRATLEQQNSNNPVVPAPDPYLPKFRTEISRRDGTLSVDKGGVVVIFIPDRSPIQPYKELKPLDITLALSKHFEFQRSEGF